MKFTYCPHCGSKLQPRPIGDEGLIPYCQACRVPLWDMFTSCIICAVVNEENEIALLRQNYVSMTNYVCVAGVIKLGESAEECAIREIREEIGLQTDSLEFVGTYPYLKKEMLMIGFRARVKKADFRISGEVDAVKWFPLSEAADHLRENSIAWQLVTTVAAYTQAHQISSL